MVVSDETELSTAVVAAIVHLVHETLLRSGGSFASVPGAAVGMVTDLAADLLRRSAAT